MTTGSRMRVAGVVATLLLLSACTGSASTGSPLASGPAESTPPATAPATAPSTASPSTSAVATADLVVLADGVQGNVGLWTLDAQAGFKATISLPQATSIATTSGGIAVVNGPAVETRKGDLATAASTISLKWPAGAVSTDVAALGLSPAGRIGLVVGADGAYSYATAGLDGQVAGLAAVAQQPFTPLIGWLDEQRMVFLTTDVQQVSRVAVGADPASAQPLTQLIGCRWVTVSADGGTIAAATGSALYVGPSADWLAGKQPAEVAQVDEGSVVWDLALDRTGGRLAYLTGVVAADGTVGSIREIVYKASASGWQKAADVSVPFNKTRGQAWLG
jgi:hypothetical protein